MGKGGDEQVGKRMGKEMLSSLYSMKNFPYGSLEPSQKVPNNCTLRLDIAGAAFLFSLSTSPAGWQQGREGGEGEGAEKRGKRKQ